MEKVFDQLVVFATEYGLKVIGAIIILIVGRIIAGMMKKFMVRMLNKSNTDPTIVSFAGSLVYILVITFTILAVLSKFGIETASIIAVLGAAGFAVGFALQGSLANFAAGLLVLVFRHYKIGDYISAAGVAGTVKEIRLFSTVLATPDNVQIIVPSGKIFGDIIMNYSANDTRRIDLVIGIGYGSDIGKALEVMTTVLKEDDRVLEDPAYQVAVSELADSSVNLVVRPWVNSSDYWGARFDLTRKIKEQLDANGIEIPFPQRVVHMTQEN
ncbi:MAG: mechanosensitive ion channel [candidate division Zixibacteria bacterium]|nr:mechanosensitive ion channel [candidate division Zixibacteria bacterium]